MTGEIGGRTSRRELLQKTATAGAAIVVGTAALPGSVAASRFEQGDRVRVTSYGATTYEQCCADNSQYCDTARRDHGDEGEVLDTCELTDIYERIYVRWDTVDSDQFFMSWITEDEIETI